MSNFDAFISYNQSRDKSIAAALQSVLQSLGKPWYQRRSLRIFRDDTNLSATPYFWQTIESALSSSRYLILLASPQSAASPWVAKEVAYWLAHKSMDTLLIALTEGELNWDHSAGCFSDWDVLPLPRELKSKFPSEPKWVDLRSYRNGARADDIKFMERAADFAAAVRGVPKEDLLSEEVRQQRRRLSLAWSAIALLLLLFGAATWQWKVAVDLEKVAVHQRQLAEASEAQANRNYKVAKSTASNFVSAVQEMIVAGTISSHDGKLLLEKTRESISALGKDAANDEVAALEWQLLDTLSFADLIVSGDGAKALETATRMLSLAEQLIAHKPDDPTHVRYVVISYQRLADVLEARSKLDEALARNTIALKIVSDALVKSPSAPVLLQVLGLTHQRIGDLLRKKQDFTGARRAFEEYLRIFRELAHRPKPEPIWVRGWAISEERVGDVLRDLGDLKGALAYYHAYQNAAVVLMGLEAPGSPNYTWRADLWIANQRIGDILFEQKDFTGALAEYRLFNKGAEEAASRNPDHGLWLRNRANSNVKMGEALIELGEAEAARKEFEEAQKTYASLVTKDPFRGSWRRSLAIAQLRIGMASQALNDLPGARARFTACLKLEFEETAFDTQLTTPREVRKECRERLSQLNESPSR